MPLFREKGLCQIFKGHTKFYEKRYDIEEEINANTIQFLVKKRGQFDDINIVNCSTMKLFKFLTEHDIDPDFEDIDYKSDDSEYEEQYDEQYEDNAYYTLCKSFIVHREKITVPLQQTIYLD